MRVGHGEFRHHRRVVVRPDRCRWVVVEEYRLVVSNTSQLGGGSGLALPVQRRLSTPAAPGRAGGS